MGYQAAFKDWKSITLKDLLVAYRKAKADCFFENTFPAAIKFAEYEEKLLKNLRKLLASLHSENGFSKNSGLLGEYRLLPKKLTTRERKGATDGHIHFSTPDRAVEHLLSDHKVTPEFRIVGDFPVDAHILSALWINTIGHKFDAKLHNSCYGARLRRIRNDELFKDEKEKPFHISAIGSFASYFQPYQQWRTDGLNAIRHELERDRNIVAASLDLKSFYHTIDPLALTSAKLHKELEIELSDGEINFNAEIASFLHRWAKGAKKFAKTVTAGKSDVSGGLAIGLTASRVISNILLHRWDKLIHEKLAPVHYGRYVDDMFLVLRDTKKIHNSLELMHHIKNIVGSDILNREDKKDKQTWTIQQGKKIQKKSHIALQADKQKIFVLQGRAGIDLLDSIEKEISELSSEHRLMPSPDQLDDSTAARVLSAAGSVGENADTLRRADGLTIRRLSWSLQLRHVETLARDLPLHEWQKQRSDFYEFAHNHILRPDKLFAHFNYLPRLLGFAISLNEWQQAEKIALDAYNSLEKLASAIPKGKKISINGNTVKAGSKLWPMVKGTLTWLFIDAATRYYNPDQLLIGQRSKKEQRLSKLFLKGIFDSLLEVESILDFRFGSEDFEKKAPLVALADLAKEPYKRILRSQSAEKLLLQAKYKEESKTLSLIESSQLLNTEALQEFLKSTSKNRLSEIPVERRKHESYLPYLFPTRPLTPAEISELAPECVGLRKSDNKRCKESPSVIWAKYTQALRGVWIKPTLLATDQDRASEHEARTTRKHIRIGTEKKHKITVALTNLKTDNEDWSAMACNKPNLSRDRYQRVSELVNQSIHLKPRPDYVFFPELSIPLKWIDSVANRLNAAGISLIAGTEYRHKPDNSVVSEACLVLTDNRLGYPSTVKIWQPKLQPAVGEDKDLTAIHGKTWNSGNPYNPRSKPIYIHNDFHFGVMVCSELQNSKARIKFQGEIDALIVLSWNQDLDTFSSLIESAALDIHAYTILVNNRKYGDSRVRSPAKKSFMRDIARVRGGDNDFVVAATLDIDSLRSFQSRAKRWSEEEDKFKPVPEGFMLKKSRRKLPPK